MTREEVFECIANQVGRHNVSCNCEKCKQMCQRTPCLGTPHDILALIEAGYIDKLAYTEWAAGIVLGHISRPIPMVQIKSINNIQHDGCCIFYHDGKCELHENGLKPTEGKLSHHEVSVMELHKEYNLTYQVAIEWCKKENIPIINKIVNKMLKHLNNYTINK